MDLSVVLPTRNGAATIARQLEALARQSWGGDWELIVSDNGSTDSTLEVVDRFRARLEAVRVVDSTGVAGPAHACNVGAREARGQMLAFCNDDDEVAPGWVAAMADAIARDGFVAGRLEHDRLNAPWMVAVRGRPQADGLIEWFEGAYYPYAFGCTLGVLRELHDRVAGFDAALAPAGEDIDYCWRLQQLGVELRFAPAAVTHYRFKPGLRATYRQAVTYAEGNVRVYKKHVPRGLPRLEHPWRDALRAWARVGRRLLGAFGRPGMARFLWELGWRLGSARASIRERAVFL